MTLCTCLDLPVSHFSLFYSESLPNSLSKAHSTAFTTSAAFPIKKKVTEPQSVPFFPEEALIDSTMRARSPSRFLLLSLFVSWPLELQASVEWEIKPLDFPPDKEQQPEPDSTADGSKYKTTINSDIWAELRMLRDMVVEQRVELRNVEGRLMETETQADEQRLVLLLTGTRLEELRRDRAALQKRLRTSEQRVEELKKVNVELRADLESQAAELLAVGGRLTASEGELQLLRRRMENLQAQDEAQEGELTTLASRMTTTEHQVDSLIEQSAKMAFYAALTESGGVGPYNTPTVIKFSNVFTNVGDAYSPTTGFFTAPVKGVYYFRFTICGQTNQGSMGVQLFHNGKSIIYNLQTRYNEFFEYLSNAVILELNVGDELHLVLPEDTSVFDNVNNHSTFSGFLLFK